MEKIERIKQFLSVSNGNGDGYGYGDGYGDGNGNGNGDGYGDGNGYGNGDGDGYGNGDGDGYGDGNGYGYGDGNGYGNGDGYGNGIKSYNGKAVYNIDGVRTIIDSVHGSYAKGSILNGGLTLTPCYIAKSGNYFAHGDTLADAVRDAESKYAEHLPIEERIRLFIEAHPISAPDTRYPAQDFYVWHHTLTGSCDAGRRAFAKDHDINLSTSTLTVEEFIELTENAYGGNIIKQLKQHYNYAKQ